MLNKNNNQTHYGQGNQYIDQSVTNNVFLTYGDSGSSNSTNNPGILVVIFLVITLSLGNLLLSLVQEYKQVIIMTPLMIGINALFRHSVRNYPAYVITVAYWIFFFVLKMIQ